MFKVVDVNPTVRLAVALALSGFAFTATSTGPYALALCALLAYAPMLVATRSLPLWLALPVALVPAACGRAAALHAAFADDVTPVLATAALVPALLVDRFITTWAPRVALLSWPCALVVTERVLTSATAASSTANATATLVPVPALDAIRYVGSDAGVAASTFAVAFFCNAFALLCGVLNRRIPDPYAQDEREAGVKLAAITALVVAIALFSIAALRAHFGSPPAAPTSPADPIVVLCAIGVVACAAVAVMRRTKSKAPVASTA